MKPPTLDISMCVKIIIIKKKRIHSINPLQIVICRSQSYPHPHLHININQNPTPVNCSSHLKPTDGFSDPPDFRAEAVGTPPYGSTYIRVPRVYIARDLLQGQQVFSRNLKPCHKKKKKNKPWQTLRNNPLDHQETVESQRMCRWRRNGSCWQRCCRPTSL